MEPLPLIITVSGLIVAAVIGISIALKSVIETSIELFQGRGKKKIS